MNVTNDTLSVNILKSTRLIMLRRKCGLVARKHLYVYLWEHSFYMKDRCEYALYIYRISNVRFKSRIGLVPAQSSMCRSNLFEYIMVLYTVSLWVGQNIDQFILTKDTPHLALTSKL